MKLEEAIKSDKFKNEVHKAGLNILYSAWWLKTVMSRDLKEYGITHEQYNILRILKGKHPQQMCVKDIACRIIEKSSNVPRTINRLVVKKLVKRSASVSDKRETAIQLTAAGMNILQITTNKINKLFDKAIKLKEQDAVTLNKLLERMRN